MTQPKVQLVAPLGNLTVPGMNVTGVVTATIGDVGVAGSIIQGNNLDIGAGIITATSFVGDQIGTYRAASLTGSPDLVVGVVTSSGFVAQITGDVTGNLTGNVVGTAGSILSGNNLHVGIATATLVGDGSNLTGVGGSSFTHQTITANGAATSIDLSAGNIITLNQSADTTVSFANTSEAMKVTITRVKDSSATARSLTWPSSIQWTYGSEPSLVTDNETGLKFNILSLLTRDSGVTWYGWEVPDVPSPASYEDGTLWAWGRNESGELGQNDTADRSSPTQVGTDTNWGSKEDGVGLNQGGDEADDDNNILQTKSDGTLWAWGRNEYGQLGLNSKVNYSSPVQVGTDTSWVMGFSNARDAGGIKDDGTLWSWGKNEHGMLGLNQAADTCTSSPTQVGTDTDWSATDGHVCLSLRARCMIKTDGTLWAWGNKYYGVLGLYEGGSSDNEAYSSPVQIPGTTWSKTKVNFGTMYGIKTNGSMWSWGKTNYGELGQNEARGSDLSSPTQIGTKTDWSDITSMYVTAFAFNTSGECYAWGYTAGGYGGFSGIHGNGAWTSSPAQLPGTTWVAGSAYRSAHAVKTDGTLWGWSVNTMGEGGTNNLTLYSSPIQIGSDTDWDTSPVRIGAQYKTKWSIKTS